MANKLIQHGGAAAATAAGGPIAGAAWEIGYPIVEDWLTGGSDQDDAAKKQQAGMQAAAGQYQQYRPVAQQARQTALGNQLSAYGGAANAMSLMYGTQYDPRNYAPNLAKNPLLTGSSQTGTVGATEHPFTLDLTQQQQGGSAPFNQLSKVARTGVGASPIGAGAATVGLLTGGDDPNRAWMLPQAIAGYKAQYGQGPDQQQTQHYLETGEWLPPTQGGAR